MMFQKVILENNELFFCRELTFRYSNQVAVTSRSIYIHKKRYYVVLKNIFLFKFGDISLNFT
jgi:hypothetical protein